MVLLKAHWSVFIVHWPVHIMFGVKTPVFLLDTLWRKVGNCATQAVHADVMGMGQTIALCKSKVRNLHHKKKQKEGGGKMWEKCMVALEFQGVHKIFSAKNNRCNTMAQQIQWNAVQKY